MSEWTLNEETQSGTFFPGSELLVSNVAELKAGLLQAFTEADHVTVDVRGVTEIDVAGIQLLCACQTFAAEQQKTLVLEIGENQAFRAFVAEVGLTQGLFGSLVN